MTKDPVCNMEVDEAKAEFESQYGGRKYYFCSEQCKKAFEEKPEHYATAA
jgi:YHS domain-containing protein